MQPLILGPVLMAGVALSLSQTWAGGLALPFICVSQGLSSGSLDSLYLPQKEPVPPGPACPAGARARLCRLTQEGGTHVADGLHPWLLHTAFPPTASYIPASQSCCFSLVLSVSVSLGEGWSPQLGIPC